MTYEKKLAYGFFALCFVVAVGAAEYAYGYMNGYEQGRHAPDVFIARNPATASYLSLQIDYRFEGPCPYNEQGYIDPMYVTWTYSYEWHTPENGPSATQTTFRSLSGILEKVRVPQGVTATQDGDPVTYHPEWVEATKIVWDCTGKMPAK